MLNLSGIPRQSVLGRALRLPLRLVPRNAVVPILQGPLRGKRWIAGSSNHGCWLGSYEFEKQRAIARAVRPGMVCWDVGAHVGFYTLLFAQLTGPKGKVYAFEPVPENLAYLRRHVAMNGFRNVEVLPVALCDHDGMEMFDRGPDSSMGRLDPQGELRVECRQADALLESGDVRPPDIVKIDVEGGEADVLRGAQRLLQNHKPLIFLATHGPEVHTQCVELLISAGYRVSGVNGRTPDVTDELVAQPTTEAE